MTYHKEYIHMTYHMKYIHMTYHMKYIHMTYHMYVYIRIIWPQMTYIDISYGIHTYDISYGIHTYDISYVCIYTCNMATNDI